MEFVKHAQTLIKITGRKLRPESPVYRQAYTNETACVSLSAQAYSESA